MPMRYNPSENFDFAPVTTYTTSLNNPFNQQNNQSQPTYIDPNACSSSPPPQLKKEEPAYMIDVGPQGGASIDYDNDRLTSSVNASDDGPQPQSMSNESIKVGIQTHARPHIDGPGIVYTGIDGYIRVYPEAGVGNFIKLMFFPCALEGPTAPGARIQYVRFFCSFNFWLSLAQVAMLIACFTDGGIATPSRVKIFGPTWTGMMAMGGRYPYKMRFEYQIWRFITPMFINPNILNMILTLFYQVRFGIYLERVWGFTRYVIIYLLITVGSTLMACVIKPNWIAGGANPPLLGILACFIMELVFGAKYLTKTDRTMWLIKSGIHIFLWFFLCLGTYSDWSAYLGATLIGVSAGLLFFADDQRKRIAALVALVVYFGLGFGLFYLVIRPYNGIIPPGE
eukprot:gene7366-8579_t